MYTRLGARLKVNRTMKKLVLALCLCILPFTNPFAQSRIDSLFYLNGEVEVVTILRNLSEAIECNYPGENLVSSIDKARLHKIVFKSGRVELCNPLEANSKCDVIYFINGEKAECRIIRASDDEIEYKLPNDNMVISSSISRVSKIEYANGRVEHNQNAINFLRFYETHDWEDVVVTYNFADTKGMVRVKDLSDKAGSIGRSEFAIDRAIQNLKKEAAELGCGLILINGSTNSTNQPYSGYIGSGAHITAIAYKLPVNFAGNTPISVEEKKAKIIESFYNNEIYMYPEDAQEKRVDVFEEKIRDKLAAAKYTQDIEEAQMMYDDLLKFIDSYERTPIWAQRAIWRINIAFDNAKKRVDFAERQRQKAAAK